MKTLYIDVYFLINFTVDILALYFSASFSKISTTVPRLIISALIGGMYAVMGILLIENSLLMYPTSLFFLVMMVLITAKGVGTYRRIKYAIAFLFFQIIIGGLVYYGYCALDGLMLTEKIDGLNSENRSLLILSLLVLLSIGVLKLIISLFGNTRSEKCVKIIIKYNGRENITEAFVDSGNLAVDPLDKTPVMIVTVSEGEKIFGDDSKFRNSLESVDYSVKKRLRAIPVSYGGNNKILYGIKPDSAYAVSRKKRVKISIVIAIDCEEDSYGGYSALIPLSALEDVFYGNF